MNTHYLWLGVAFFSFGSVVAIFAVLSRWLEREDRSEAADE